MLVLCISKTEEDPAVYVLYTHDIYKYLNIRRQHIILDAPLNAFYARLQESARLKANPDTKHGGIAMSNRL